MKRVFWVLGILGIITSPFVMEIVSNRNSKEECSTIKKVGRCDPLQECIVTLTNGKELFVNNPIPNEKICYRKITTL